MRSASVRGTEVERVIVTQKRLWQSVVCQSLFCVPGAGIEPACLAALVFETSASTDSAIRAIVCALSEFVRVHHNFRNCASIDSFRERTAKVEKTYDTAKSEIIFVKE